MARSTLIVILGLVLGGIVGLAYVGGLALLGTFDRPEPPSCEIIEADVLLNAIEFVRVPGMDNEAEGIPFPGALMNYTRLDCNGNEFLIRTDALTAPAATP